MSVCYVSGNVLRLYSNSSFNLQNNSMTQVLIFFSLSDEENTHLYHTNLTRKEHGAVFKAISQHGWSELFHLQEMPKKKKKDKRQAWNENTHMEFQITEETHVFLFFFFLNLLNIH